MRIFLGLALLLAGCASPLPAANPQQAWVDLYSSAGNTLIAQQLDGRNWADGRYFEVTPGAHQLQVGFEYVVLGSAGDDLMASDSRSCRMVIDYASFAAGQRYLLKAGALGYQPWLRLYDQQHRLLAAGRPTYCL